MQNTPYSLSIVHKLTAGKERWTLVRTGGEPIDVGVVLDDVVEKLTLKSDISTFSPHHAPFKPTKVVTPDESEVIFETLLLKTPRKWKIDYGVPAVFIFAGLFLSAFTEQFGDWFFFGGFLLGFLALTAAHVLRNPSWEVTDGSGVRVGLVTYDTAASFRLKTFVIETSTGRWRVAEASRAVLRRGATKARIYATAGLGTVLSIFYNVNQYIFLAASTLATILVTSIWKIRKRRNLNDTEPDDHCFTLLNEEGTQIGHWSFADINYSRNYNIRIDDSRLGPRVAAAVALIVARNYET